MATATPIVAPYMPIAMPRSRPGSNSWAIRASETANIAAPPTPCSARARLRKVASGASAQSSEATEKMPRPAANTRRRPSRSASDPAVSTRAASDSAYASTTHCRSVKLASRSSRIDGSATFTTVMSSSSMNVATETAIKVHHLRCIGPPCHIGSVSCVNPVDGIRPKDVTVDERDLAGRSVRGAPHPPARGRLPHARLAERGRRRGAGGVAAAAAGPTPATSRTCGGWLTTVVARVSASTCSARAGRGARTRSARASPSRSSPARTASTPSTRRCSPTRSGWRCSSCSRRSARPSAWPSCCTTCSPSPSTRSRRSSGAHPTAARQLASRARRRVRGAADDARRRPRPPARGRRRLPGRGARRRLRCARRRARPRGRLPRRPRRDRRGRPARFARGPRSGRGRLAGADVRAPVRPARARRSSTARRASSSSPTGGPSPWRASPSPAGGSPRSTCSPTRRGWRSWTSRCWIREPRATHWLPVVS